MAAVLRAVPRAKPRCTRNEPVNPDFLPSAVRSLHLIIGGDPIARVGPHWAEIVVRLHRPIEIARIEANTIGRSQFPVMYIARMKTTTTAAPEGRGIALHGHR